MNIALLGYGKMGKTIEKIALERGHTIVLKKDADNTFDGIETADVAIDFSLPSVAFENISTCLEKGIPIVSGTTGWLNDYEKAIELCKQKNGAFLYGSNFGLGVNLFFEINEFVAKLMAKYSNYNVSIEEIHHTQKLDAPSGTAISLANEIIKNTPYNQWKLIPEVAENDLPITALRIENVPGTHSVFYNSAVDTIEIKHTAHSREGFAYGAIIAAEWIVDKNGVFTMKDVLNSG